MTVQDFIDLRNALRLNDCIAEFSDRSLRAVVSSIDCQSKLILGGDIQKDTFSLALIVDEVLSVPGIHRVRDLIGKTITVDSIAYRVISCDHFVPSQIVHYTVRER